MQLHCYIFFVMLCSNFYFCTSRMLVVDTKLVACSSGGEIFKCHFDLRVTLYMQSIMISFFKVNKLIPCVRPYTGKS